MELDIARPKEQTSRFGRCDAGIDDHRSPIDKSNIREPSIVSVPHEELQHPFLFLDELHAAEKRRPVAVRKVVHDGSGKIILSNVSHEVLIGVLVEHHRMVVAPVGLMMIMKVVHEVYLSLATIDFCDM